MCTQTILYFYKVLDELNNLKYSLDADIFEEVNPIIKHVEELLKKVINKSL